MINAKSIKQRKGTQDVLDHPYLKQLAIDHIQRLSGRVWTDYNVHDPGVTLVEILAYAITDLGFRTRNKVPAILASPGQPTGLDSFYGPKEILYMAPLSARDYAKIFLTIDGVKNAQLVRSTRNPDFKGIYDLELEVETDADRAEIANIARSLFESNSHLLVLDKQEGVHSDAHHHHQGHRNLCETLDEIRFLEQVKIKFEIALELASGTYVNQFLAEIVALLRNALCPSVRYHQVQDLIASGMAVEDVFSGPDLPFGRILDEEMDQRDRKTVLRMSDIVRDVMSLRGVVNILDLVIVDQYAVHHKWLCPIDPDTAPVLDLDGSTILIYNNDSKDLIHQSNLQGKRGATGDLTAIKAMHKMSLVPPPPAKFLDLEQYYSIQNEFPAIYGVGEAGLMTSDPARRKGLAKQFKGYLMFFDQVLANYLSQLSHLRELFSLDNVQQTYHFQALLDVPGAEYIFLPFLEDFIALHATLDDPNDPTLVSREWQRFKAGFLDWRGKHLGIPGTSPAPADLEKQRQEFKDSIYGDYMQGIEALERHLYEAIEGRNDFVNRRNRILDHLLARFAVDVKVLEFTKPENPDRAQEIDTKLRILRDIPQLSKQRGIGANFELESHDAHNELGTSGPEKQLRNLLSIEPEPGEHLKPSKVKDFTVKDGSEPAPDPDVWTSFNFPKAKTEDEAIQQFFQYLGEAKNYRWSAERLCLEVIGPQGVVADMPLPNHPNSDHWMAVRDSTVATVTNYSKEFENLHLIEHLELRPYKSAPFFGFSIYDMSGEMLLFECTDFQDFDSRNAELAAFLTLGRKRANYEVQTLMARQYKLALRIGGKLHPGPEIYGTPANCEAAIKTYCRAFEELYTHHATKNSRGMDDFRLEETAQVTAIPVDKRLQALYELGLEEANYVEGESIADNLHGHHNNRRAEVELSGKVELETGKEVEFKFISRRKIEATAGLLPESNFMRFVRHHRSHLEQLYLRNVYENPSIRFKTKNHELYDRLHDPYSHVVTLVFPAWPTRFQDLNFRAFVWKMVHAELPSHLVVNVKWLPYSAMATFERIQGRLGKQRLKLNSLLDERHQLSSNRDPDSLKTVEDAIKVWEVRISRLADKLLQLITDHYD